MVQNLDTLFYIKAFSTYGWMGNYTKNLKMGTFL